VAEATVDFTAFTERLEAAAFQNRIAAFQNGIAAFQNRSPPFQNRIAIQFLQYAVGPVSLELWVNGGRLHSG